MCCLQPGEYNIECRDSAGDGWHDGYINIGGVYFCNDFQTGFSVQRTFTLTDNTNAATAPPNSFEYYEEFGICSQSTMLTEEECRSIFFISLKKVTKCSKFCKFSEEADF